MDLRQKSISGIKWNSLLSFITAGLQLLSMFILARLLSPAVFGLIGMTTLVVGFAQTFADMGISNAIIHRQDVVQEDLSSIFWLNILLGVSLFVILCAMNPLLTAFYNEPGLARPLYLSCLVFLIAPFGQLSQALLQKELCFRSLAIIQLMGALLNTSTSIVLALSGKGVYSIIYGQLASTLLQVMLFCYYARSYWRPHCCFSARRVKSYMSFGLYQMGDKVINYFNSNLDYLLIGSLLGVRPLGYYTLAYNLVLKPSQLINPILTKVAFPVFSRMQNDTSKMKNGYLRMLKYVSAINCPIMAGLAATAPFAIQYLGAQWLPSLLLIQILTIVGLLRSLCNPVGALLLAKGRADLGFKWNAGIMVTQLPGLYLGAKLGGSVGVAMAFAVLMVLYTVAAYPVLIRPILEPCLPEYVLSMFPALWKSMVMGAIVWLSGTLLHAVPNSLALCAQIILGAAIYALLMLTLQKDILVELKTLFAPKKQMSLT
jgi:O-antigen/teichoic acid export membrane protein